MKSVGYKFIKYTFCLFFAINVLTPSTNSAFQLFFILEKIMFLSQTSEFFYHYLHLFRVFSTNHFIVVGERIHHESGEKGLFSCYTED